MRKLLLLALPLLWALSAKAVTILINGVPVDRLYVDSQGRLYLTPGPGRKPVKIEIPSEEKERDIKISGKAYMHWRYEMSGEEERNTFRITRNYLDIQKNFREGGYFRTTVDVKQEREVDGGSYVVRLKYAYTCLEEVLPGVNFKFGMTHKPWIDWEEHNGWLHRDLEKTFVESPGGAHLLSSSDIGLALKGSGNSISWEAGIFNGEGYHGEELSRHFGKSIEGRLSARLFRGFILSGHTVHSFDHSGEGKDYHIYHVHGLFRHNPLLLSAQYVVNDVEGNRIQRGFSVNGDVDLKPFINHPLGLLARYDRWNPDERQSGKREQFIYGMFYCVNQHVRLTLAHERLLDEAGDDASTLIGVTHVKW